MKRNNKIFMLIALGRKPFMIVLAFYTIWWIGVITGLIALQGMQVTIGQFGSERQFYGAIVHSIAKGTLTYYILLFKFAVPFVKKQNRRGIILNYFLFLTVLITYEYCWDYESGSPPPGIMENLSLFFYFVATLTAYLLMTAISVFIASWMESNDTLKRENEREKQKLNAELAAIRYQINPHFLFNSLSFIYTKTVRQSPEAAHAVHLLSEIMSYALQQTGELGSVPLALEIAQIKKVVELNRIRLNNKLNFDFLESLDPGAGHILTSTRIPPLAFITLVENAFKHADLNDEKNGVLVHLGISAANISFSVRNKKRRVDVESMHGIGLSNVTQRMQMMFGSAHTFAIEEDLKNYFTEIRITLIQP